MVISLRFKDKEYEGSLMVRLISLTRNLDINVCNMDREFDILLTDEIISNPNVISVGEGEEFDINILSNSRDILNYVVNRYKENTGINIYELCEINDRVISFYSYYGGSGSSSISITLARQLLLNLKRVIYITDEDRYYEPKLKRNKEGIELSYDIFTGSDFNISNYIEKDGYNLDILRVSNKRDIKELVKRIKGYDYIVIDFGKYGTPFGNYIYLVLNYEDMRLGNIMEGSGSDLNIILNRVTRKGLNNTKYTILFDQSSYCEKLKHIDISLNDTFSRNILTITKDILNEQI